ncbi:MAG TPA: hypothetical protein PLI97_04450 [Fluviicola sp.]|nr:hypothetical protein [Fluviicola sp.]
MNKPVTNANNQNSTQKPQTNTKPSTVHSAPMKSTPNATKNPSSVQMNKGGQQKVNNGGYKKAPMNTFRPHAGGGKAPMKGGGGHRR